MRCLVIYPSSQEAGDVMTTVSVLFTISETISNRLVIFLGDDEDQRALLWASQNM